jgi:hypothetical protein
VPGQGSARIGLQDGSSGPQRVQAVEGGGGGGRQVSSQAAVPGPPACKLAETLYPADHLWPEKHEPKTPRPPRVVPRAVHAGIARTNARRRRRSAACGRYRQI